MIFTKMEKLLSVGRKNKYIHSLDKYFEAGIYQFKICNTSALNINESQLSDVDKLC